MNNKSEKKYGFWNWGTGLAIAITAGCLGMIFLVYTATSYEFQMVDEDYYEKEVEFNDKLAAMKNANKLSDTMHFAEMKEHLIIQMPRELIGKSVKGSLTFYCPIDASKDFTKDLVFTDSNLVAVSMEGLLPTQYNVIAKFTLDNENYHLEQVYKVNK